MLPVESVHQNDNLHHYTPSTPKIVGRFEWCQHVGSYLPGPLSSKWSSISTRLWRAMGRKMLYLACISRLTCTRATRNYLHDRDHGVMMVPGAVLGQARRVRNAHM